MGGKVPVNAHLCPAICLACLRPEIEVETKVGSKDLMVMDWNAGDAGKLILSLIALIGSWLD